MPTPKKIGPTEVQIVAVLTAQGLRQEEIAELLGISQSGVSRAVREAKKDGILVQKMMCTLPRKRRMELAVKAHCDDLLDRLVAIQDPNKRHLKELWIVDVGSEATKKPGAKGYEDRVRGFSKKVAAHLVHESFDRVRSIGWTWGITLHHIVQSLVDDHADEAGMRSADPILSFPVSGNPPPGCDNVLRNPAILAERFNAWINGDNGRSEIYSNAPASLPHGFDGDRGRTLREYFESHESYVRIFKGEDPLIASVDTMLTSAGNACRIEDPWVAAAAHEADMDPSTLEQWTHGNLGGTFLEKQDAPDDMKEEIDGVNGRWLGVTTEHFEACAARAAADENLSGVILAASGNKKEIAIEAVRRSLVSTLYVDQDLAHQISKALEQEAS